MKETYVKLDSISHCHKRPDMYIGENKFQRKEFLIFEKGKIVSKEDLFCDGVLRLFIELLSNSMDNYFRSKESETPMTRLDVFFDEQTNKIEIKNDGNQISHEKHEETNIYIPELIFGHLLSSSNYQDDMSRYTSGRNGLGGKLTNVFSSEFQIECYDSSMKILYKQKWVDNMRRVSKPKIIEKNKKENHYTKVSYKIDFTKFKDEENNYMDENTKYTESTIASIKKYLVDASMLMHGLPVYFNKEKMQIKNGCLLQYGRLYRCLDLEENFKKNEYLQGKFESSKTSVEYCIVPYNKCTESISFVNGIITKEGGIHDELLYTKIYQVLNEETKFKKFSLTLKDLKRYITIIIRASITNPTFSSQSKHKLTGSKDNLNTLIRFNEKEKQNITSKLLRWKFMEEIKENFKMREELDLKSQEKKRGFRTIANYDKANYSTNPKKKKECVLILTEGLSAKTFAVKAIQHGIENKKGRAYFGIFPLKGKLLNVRNTNAQMISKNKEITDIIQILNLRHQVDYCNDNNFNTLSYGKLLILADSDVDGKHISSLIILLFNHLFPSILKRKDPFIQICFTPIAKVTLRNETLTFYSDYQYKKKLEEIEQGNLKVKHIKYFKGLGTCSSSDISKFADKIVNLVHTGEETDDALDVVFHKLKTNERKDWILQHNPSEYQEINKDYPIPLYLNQELILYSIDDCHRSIGSISDGLKPSQRKILYSLFKKGLSYEKENQIKVASLSGYISDNTNYHHGEMCLNGSIIKMAQHFPFSNNIPLLSDCGQFGSRSYHGKDAASPRYIYTKLGPLSDHIFVQKDNPLLSHAYDDGQKVEYETYCPIIPMILVNGMTSIGTGWSSSIPSFNLLDIIEKLKILMSSDEKEKFDQLKLKPYYHGFQGAIVASDDDTKFYCHGVFQKKEHKKKTVHVITEIPIDISIDNYKNFLESKMENKEIKDLINLSSANCPHFEFQFCDPEKELAFDDFKLTSTISLSNMILFNFDKKIEKYKKIDDIIIDFFNHRLELYGKRIQLLLHQLRKRKSMLTNKARFILDVNSNKIPFIQLKEEEICKTLENEDFTKFDESFDYLLSMNMKQLTKCKYETLQIEIIQVQKEIENLVNTNAKQLWMSELEELEREYKKHYAL